MNKRILSLVLAVLMVAAVFAVFSIADKAPALESQLTLALDANDCADGILYTLDENTQTATVGKAIYAEHNTSGYTGNGVVTIPDVVTKDGTDYVVRQIGRNAFDGSDVKEVIILNSVNRIGEMAFADCVNLERVAMGTGVTEIAGFAFWHCSKLVDASLGKNVKTIGGCAFWSCDSLEIITIPQGATTVMEQAFKDCANLKTVIAPSTITIAENAFEGIAAAPTVKNDYSPFIYAPTIYAEAGETVIYRLLLEGNPGGIDIPAEFILNEANRSLTEAGGVEFDLESAYNGTVFTFGEGVEGNKDFAVTFKGVTTNGALNACDHANTENVITVAPTCETAGEQVAVCTKCHNVIGEAQAVEALGHNYVDFVIEAVCLDGGYTTHKCSRCGDLYKDAETAPTGHTMDAGTVSSMPTHSATGVKKFVCETCKRVDTAVLPMVGDINGDGKRNSRDVIDLMKYILGQRDFGKYTFYIETANCAGDLTDEGAIRINNRDLIELMKAILDTTRVLKSTPIPTATIED